MNATELAEVLRDLYTQSQVCLKLEERQGCVEFYAEDAMKAVIETLDAMLPTLLGLSTQELEAIEAESERAACTLLGEDVQADDMPHEDRSTQELTAEGQFIVGLHQAGWRE